MTHTDTTAGGEAVFLAELDRIERVIAFVCARHHLSSADADDFGSHVKLKLIEDDYAILRKFEGRSTLRTFLTVVINRLFLDYRTSAWGKWRPSAEARRGGATAVLLEQLMTRDGCAFDDACELMITNHRVAATRKDLERIAAGLPPRVKRRMEPEEALDQVPAPQPAPDDLAIDRDRQALADRASLALRRALAGLDTQDRLILTLLHKDGHSLAVVARMLRLDPKPLYRRIERVGRELRRAMEAEGIDRAAVRELFESATVSVTWPDG